MRWSSAGRTWTEDEIAREDGRVEPGRWRRGLLGRQVRVARVVVRAALMRIGDPLAVAVAVGRAVVALGVAWVVPAVPCVLLIVDAAKERRKRIRIARRVPRHAHHGCALSDGWTTAPEEAKALRCLSGRAVESVLVCSRRDGGVVLLFADNRACLY